MRVFAGCDDGEESSVQTIVYIVVTLLEIGLVAALVGMAMNSRDPSRAPDLPVRQPDSW